MWRKVGRVFEHILERKFIVPAKLHAVGEPCVDLATSFRHHVSLGEAPTTMAMVVVRGRTCRMFSKKTASLLVAATTVSYWVNLLVMTRGVALPAYRS